MRNNKQSTIPHNLLSWYFELNIDLPWRETKDPYKIWLSEVMLQQTQVKTVIPYYHRWLKKFPTIKSVAEAPQETILKQWEGLGYYGRARNFHKACTVIMADLSGHVPDNPEAFSSLPGVGPYISAAVSSIAFGFPMPAVDGNVKRIISRLNCSRIPVEKSFSYVNSHLLKIIPDARPGDFNQAMMDLGREICTPKNPDCNVCPVMGYCKAFVENSVDKYPVRHKRKLRPHYNVAVGIIWKNDKILISKRRENGLLGGLWEFPGGKLLENESAPDCLVREVREELNIVVIPGEFITRIKHAYTHFSITLDAYHCEYLNGTPQPIACDDWRWITPDKIKSLPFPQANHKLFPHIFKQEFLNV